ncbi:MULTISPECIES: hypothetical protein [unclassified Microbacterium]|uniref:hypothetical protein n=1 Tax=unclassified Microbacterium TaxID=2609290 RepID=UPI003744F553
MTDLAYDLFPASPRRDDAPGRRLHPVEAPARRRPKLAYGVIAVAGAVAIALAQMLLSILTTQGSFEVAALSQQQRDLSYEKQMLYDDVAGLGSPQYLAANAAALGMVVADAPSYLRLSDGAVIGSSQPATDASSIDAIGRAAVGNALITDTPLVTDPDSTIQGAPMAETPAGADSATPPPIADGLPTPATR